MTRISENQIDREVMHEPFEGRFLSFATITESSSYNNQRFIMQNLSSVLALLGISAEFRLDHGSWGNGQEESSGYMILLVFMHFSTLFFSKFILVSRRSNLHSICSFCAVCSTFMPYLPTDAYLLRFMGDLPPPYFTSRTSE
jgi:hypothetical protein